MAVSPRTTRAAIAGATALPALIFYAAGEEVMLPFILLIGLILAFLIAQWRAIPHVFAVFLATYFFSVEVDVAGGAALALPAEPLAMLLAASGLMHHFINPGKAAFYFKREALPWMIALWALSLLASTTFSTMWLVSAKYTFMQSVYMAVGIFTLPIILAEGKEKLSAAALWFVLPALFFGVFSVLNLLPYQFNPGAASNIARPFFTDHTVYSATISLIIPLFFLQYKIFPTRYSAIFFLIGLLMVFSIYISSSRGAWVGLLAATLFFIFIKLNGKIRHLAGIAAMLAVLVLMNLETLERKIFTNLHISRAAESSIQQQALSAANITSDVSNLERLNRWKCAWRMGLEKPLLGYGPGTYQFQYLPVQREEDMTYISVTDAHNTIQGRGGSAHSEYFLALSENGFTGLLIFTVLQAALLLAFFGVWHGPLSVNEKHVALAIYLGLLTYTIHGFFNNFLNQAQMGLTWWMMVGTLIHLSAKSKRSEITT